MNLWRFSLQTWRVWSLPSPFAGKCEHFELTHIFQSKWSFLSLSSSSSLLCSPISHQLMDQIFPESCEIPSSAIFRSMLCEVTLYNVGIIASNFLALDDEAHVPPKLLSAFTNCSHLIISVHSSHVCIVVNYYFVWLVIDLSILPSASVLLLTLTPFVDAEQLLVNRNACTISPSWTVCYDELAFMFLNLTCGSLWLQ